MTQPAGEVNPPTKRTVNQTVAILGQSAVKACVQAFVVLLIGRLALHLVGGIWGQMIPSLPPGLSHAPDQPGLPAWWHSWVSLVRGHAFAVVFTLIFLLTAWTRLARCSNEPAAYGHTARGHKIGRKLSDEWFGLLVGNAFGALFTVMALSWVQQFSVTQWFYGWLLKPIIVHLATAARSVFGEAFVDSIQALCSWYSANLFKLNFWLFYLGFICDDLGLPNLKTLGHWIWRRIRQRKEAGDSGYAEKSKIKPEIRT